MTLVALSSTTHEFNQSQRFLRLAFSPGAGAGGFNVAAPADRNVAPPGYYMLFVLNGNGVPSVARMVLLGGTAGGNAAPTVNAGPDQTVTLPALASLAGSASDDGQPGAFTTTWSKLSGPGSVSFGDAAALTTAAGFSMPGAYVLRLSGNDGAVTSVDDVAVTVQSAPGASGSGLTAKYYNGTNFESLALTRIDPTVDFTWGYASPGAGVQADGFSARWSGQIVAPCQRQLRFQHGLERWRAAVGEWPAPHRQLDRSRHNDRSQRAAPARRGHEVQRDDGILQESPGWGKAQLFWAYPGQAQVVVPQSQLYPDAVPPNQPPTVNAGADQTITLPATASLLGSASDDGKPGALTTTWTKLSGPGAVSFGNPSALATTASFSTPGAYVLRLSASDGALTSIDDVALGVNPEPATSGSGLTGRYYNGKSFNSLVFLARHRPHGRLHLGLRVARQRGTGRRLLGALERTDSRPGQRQLHLQHRLE